MRYLPDVDPERSLTHVSRPDRSAAPSQVARDADGRAEARATDHRHPVARLAKRVQDHDLLGLSAEMAYRFLFAVFPLGLFVAAVGAFVAGLVHVDDPAGKVLAALRDNLPGQIADSIRPELTRVMDHARPDLVSAGALGALWAATGGTNALLKGMNRAFDVDETRPFLLRYAIAVGLTLLASVGVLASFVTIVGGAVVTQKLAEKMGLGDQAWALIQVLRWPAVIVALTVAVAILYRYGPALVAPWRFVLLGAAAFAVGWVAATFLLVVYVTRIADYGATYGSLAGVIVLMLWFYVTALLLAIGAEIVPEATRRWEPGALRPRTEEIEARERLDRMTDEAKATVTRRT
jgi:membrane protein